MSLEPEKKNNFETFPACYSIPIVVFFNLNFNIVEKNRQVVVVVVPFIFISHFSSVRNNFTRAQGPVIVIAKEEI